MAEKKKKRIWLRVLIIVVAVFVVTGVGVGIYASDYYHSDEKVQSVMANATINNDYAVFESESDIGFVFYPGGKVEYSAYAPLMQKLSDNGITCIIAKMPLNLAVLKSDAWKDAINLKPNIKSWYIGGHSLGGAMAASSVDESVFDGIVLLGAYSTKEISIPSITIHGSNDKVMNKEKFQDNFSHLKQNTDIIIEGGNHANFGCYGTQDGDGTATITGEQQIEETANAISEFIKATSK